MITQDEAVLKARPHTGYHAPVVLEANLDVVDSRKVWLIEFGTPELERHATVKIDALSGDYIGTVCYDIEPFTPEAAAKRQAEKIGEVERKIRRLLKQRKRVEALAEWRQCFGGTLQEAKAAITQYEEQ